MAEAAAASLRFRPIDAPPRLCGDWRADGVCPRPSCPTAHVSEAEADAAFVPRQWLQQRTANNARRRSRTAPRHTQPQPSPSPPSAPSSATLRLSALLSGAPRRGLCYFMSRKLPKGEDRLFSQLRWTLHCHGFLRCASASDERCVLYWGHALPPPAALSRLPPHCRVLHFPGLQEVSHKDLLAANVERQRRRTRSLTLFPHIPTAFALPRSGREWLRQHRAEGGAVHAEVEALLDALHSREDGGACAEQWTDDAESAAFYSGHAEAAAEPPPSAGRAPLWILKPARAGSGHGVVVVDLQQPPSPAVLRALSRPSLVAQRYVERPLLLDGCKVDLRLYVLLLSSLSPARVQPCRTSAARFPEFPFQVFLYEDGLMRLASLPYPRDAAALSEPNALSSPFVHLTNNAVNAQRGAGWGALRNRAFRDWLEALRCGHAEAEGVHGHRLAEAVTVGVEQCVLSALSSSPALLRVGASPACAAHFALLGVDVLLDCDGRAWLCEVNHLPDLQVAASPYSPVFPVDARVKIGVIADALTLLGLPRGEAGTDSPDNADTPGRWTRAIDDGEAERHRVGGFRRLA